MQLFITLRVRNAKNRNRLNRKERRGGLSEDQSKSYDLVYSNSEAVLRQPSTWFRVRIGASSFDVNKQLARKLFKNTTR